MREADFGAVDDAIAEGLDEGEEIVVAGVEDDLLERGLESRNISKGFEKFEYSFQLCSDLYGFQVLHVAGATSYVSSPASRCARAVVKSEGSTLELYVSSFG